ncbi:hypothetical protein [Actinoallomurus liliacearum]|uniref:hypothetical protein n=1 Tax=Actinoallomurus liliacearum TaxID=1080073 RepID=UPI0031EDA405
MRVSLRRSPNAYATLNNVASRNAGSQPLRPRPRIRVTCWSAWSKNASSSSMVKARFVGSPSYSWTWTAVLTSVTTCTGCVPNRVWHWSAQP